MLRHRKCVKGGVKDTKAERDRKPRHTNQSILQEINPVGLIFIGRTDAETPILRPLASKSQFIEIDRDAGKH